MQFIDLKSQYADLKEKIDFNLQRVLDHGQYVMGPEVAALESRLAEYVGVSHSVSCSSGTDALIMSLMAAEIGQGDIVITTPFTFIATAEAIALVGATPIFVDIEPDTFNISPVLLEKTLQDLSSGAASVHGELCKDFTRVKAIISVDLFGLAADADRINKLAADYGLLVIEDAAQGFGGSYRGSKSGGLSALGCTSFFPAKPLGCYGDGGAIFTNDDDLVKKLRSIRVHGQGEHKYQNVRLGVTGRLDTIQAAVLLAKIDHFDWEIEQRQRVANKYTELLSQKVDLECPQVPEGYVSAWAQYTVKASDAQHREELLAKLKAAGVPTAIYYVEPLHQQKVFEYLGYQADAFPVSVDASTRVFSLPMHPYLSDQEISYICSAI